MLVHAVTSSRLDYCNSLYINMNKDNIYKLQKVQNAAARLVTRRRKRDSISSTLAKLHWLKVESRIIFKVILLVFKSIHGQCSDNLTLCYKRYNCRPELSAVRIEGSQDEVWETNIWLCWTQTMERSTIAVTNY